MNLKRPMINKFINMLNNEFNLNISEIIFLHHYNIIFTYS